MFGLGVQELLLILLVLILLFGAKKIPEIARGLGKSVSEFKKGARDLDEEIRREDTEKRQPPEKQNLAG
jgi:sec-independent protein translocase protein TatA